MKSLRSRLVFLVVGLVAMGLMVFAAITYAEQRSFLYNRVDRQVRAAVRPVDHALTQQLQGEVIGPDGSGPSGEPGIGLPPGTFGQLRDSKGKTLGEVVLTYGDRITAQPSLPKSIPLGKVITVDGQGDSGDYRVVAYAQPQTGNIVIAALPLREANQTLRQLLLVEGLLIAGVLLGVGLLAWWLVRLGLSPLDRMGNTARSIAGGELSNRVQDTDPATEVGRLGMSLNSMLDQLEEAFGRQEASEERLRQFLADASHELRTPLASVRGYAELLRTGAATTPEDKEKAVRRIEEEAARMGVLVEDLLTLARLDEVRDPEFTSVDLAELAERAVEDAQTKEAARKITLSVDGPALVQGNGEQLRQVMDNLLRNAVSHTPPRTPIEVTLTRADSEVQLVVRDHGKGLPTENTDELFERFWREKPARTNGGGSGLGLSIVAAIVNAHSGRVEAENAPDGGAKFTVFLAADK